MVLLTSQVCVTAGPNGVLDTLPAAGNERVGDTITTGTNGICRTVAAGDDVQAIPEGRGKPNTLCIRAGANGFVDSLLAGDDQFIGADVSTGPDGICDTKLSNANIPATTCPSAADLQAYLNEVWGRQANVWFTVTRSDHTVNYDLDFNGAMAHPEIGSAPNRDEALAIILAADNPSVNYNIYYVHDLDYAIGMTSATFGATWIAADGANSPLNNTAHEVGHLLGFGDESNDILDVMYHTGLPSNPRRVLKEVWDKVNPNQNQ